MTETPLLALGRIWEFGFSKIYALNDLLVCALCWSGLVLCSVPSSTIYSSFKWAKPCPHVFKRSSWQDPSTYKTSTDSAPSPICSSGWPKEKWQAKTSPASHWQAFLSRSQTQHLWWELQHSSYSSTGDVCF